jgi:hypothetical protein
MNGIDRLTENPLVGGLVALTVGAVIGAMIPATRREGELLGEARDRMMDGVKRAARTGVDQAKHVAVSAVSAATETAKREARHTTSRMRSEPAL